MVSVVLVVRKVLWWPLDVAQWARVGLPVKLRIAAVVERLDRPLRRFIVGS